MPNVDRIPKVFADFHNADVQGRLRLNCLGTIEDLARQGIELQDGQLLTFYGDELELEGIVQYSPEENVWVAVIDWNAIRESEVVDQEKIHISF
ncbi:MAG: hypothetical protein F6K47_07610 [Symploca sp. SIO2E6]|nr:hypothetical protein [Symploca sp. SIO2E6]